MDYSDKFNKLREKIIDNKKDKTYTENTKGALIRNMFPWVNLVDTDYKFIWEYLAAMNVKDIENLVSFIMAYYWSSVWTKLAANKHSETIKYDWLPEICENIILYYENALQSNNEQ